jgi:hypothetical protein
MGRVGCVLSGVVVLFLLSSFCVLSEANNITDYAQAVQEIMDAAQKNTQGLFCCLVLISIKQN